MAVGKNITWRKRESGSNIIFQVPYNMEAVGKNVKCGRVEEDGKFGEENQDLK